MSMRMNRMNIMLPGHRAYEVCYSMQLCRGVCESCSHSGDWDRQERTLPSVRAGVSFVIPSFARPHNLYTLLPGLLRHRTMQHPESEIIISHASTRSWRERLSLDNSTQTACAPKACASNAVGKPSHRLCGECAPQPWRLRHLDHTLQNRKFLTALRFVAAAEARNGGVRPAPHHHPGLGPVPPTSLMRGSHCLHGRRPPANPHAVGQARVAGGQGLQRGHGGALWREATGVQRFRILGALEATGPSNAGPHKSG